MRAHINHTCWKTILLCLPGIYSARFFEDFFISQVLNSIREWTSLLLFRCSKSRWHEVLPEVGESGDCGMKRQGWRSLRHCQLSVMLSRPTCVRLKVYKVPCLPLNGVDGSWGRSSQQWHVLRDLQRFHSCIAPLGLSSCAADSSLGDTLVLGFRGDPFSAPSDGFDYKAWLNYRVVMDPDTNET